MAEPTSSYLLKRVALLAVVLVLGATFVFGSFFVLPGDPIVHLLPRGITQEVTTNLIEELKLNEPISAQYVNFIVKMFTGDFPTSVTYRQGVDSEEFIYRAFAATIELYLLTAFIGCLLGAFLEEAISRLKSRHVRAVGHGFELLMFGIPISAMSLLLLISIAEFDLGFPVRGGTLMPVLAGVFSTCGAYALIARQPFEARPPGLRGWLDGIVKRTLSLLSMPERRASLLVLSAWIMATVIVVELTFSRDGLGLLFFDSLMSRDFPVGMSVSFVIVMFVIVVQFIADVIATLALRSSWAQAQYRAPRPNPLLTADQGLAPARSDAAKVQRPSGLLNLLLASLVSSWRGRVAIGLLLFMIIVGVGAPVFAVVEDPLASASIEVERRYYDEYEGTTIWQWQNPHPPTFDESQYTGFTHPLGTDAFGRDVQSLVVYGLREELVLAAFIVSVVFVIGIAVNTVAYALRGGLDAVRLIIKGGASALAWTLVAIPLPVGLAMILSVSGREFWTVPAVTLVAMWVWAVHSLLVLGRSAEPAPSAVEPDLSLADDLRATIHEILHVSKFAFLVAYLSFAALAFMHMADPTQIFWNTVLYEAWAQGGFLLGAWWWIVPPLVATLLLGAAVYVTMDTMEKAAAAHARGGTIKEKEVSQAPVLT